MRVLHPALAHLLRLRFRARVRNTLRGLREPRKAVFFAVGLLLLCFWILPSLMVGVNGGRANPETVRQTAPVLMLAMCVFSLISRADEWAIYFAPCEVGFLFSGPFTRRQLLVFKLALTGIGLVFSSLLFSFILLRSATFWIAGFVSMFLAFGFMNLINMAIGLLRQTVTARAYNWTRKLVLGGIVIAVALGAARALDATADGGLPAILERAPQSGALKYLCAPFAVFARILTAESLFPEMIGWAAAGLAMDALLVVLVLRLDADYLEAAVGISQKYYARRQRMLRGGMAAAGPVSTTRRRAMRWRLPQPPRMRGAGPILWRQALNALRNGRGLLLLLVAMSVFGLVMFAGLPQAGEAVWGLLLAVGLWMSIMLTLFVRFDFRCDIENMELLKALPVSSATIAIGELLMPVAVTTTIQLVMVGGIAISEGRPLILFAAAAIVFPLNTLLYGLENLFFLMWPTKAVASNPGDLQFMGRQIVTMLAKLIVLVLCCGLAGVCAFAAWAVTGGSLIATAVTAWVCIMAEAAGVVSLVAWVFRRFDVSLETPAD